MSSYLFAVGLMMHWSFCLGVISAFAPDSSGWHHVYVEVKK